ncbi:hypothetical protein DPMN_085592 [Dreissena polymorpha]|uniref:Uncharacterized protein n=1 Tax=Dreissena polymorpha TaxID=45954 RepID=A0A9D4BD05_DREPO|nr:hypothetical protein DPMN_085592 [Dreissena polymorpha]
MERKEPMTCFIRNLENTIDNGTTNRKNKKRQDTLNDIQTQLREIQGPLKSGINPIRSELHDLTDSDEELDDDISCCNCNQITHVTLGNQPCLKIVNWAQSDRFECWEHLAFCTSVRVVRRNDL